MSSCRSIVSVRHWRHFKFVSLLQSQGELIVICCKRHRIVTHPILLFRYNKVHSVHLWRGAKDQPVDRRLLSHCLLSSGLITHRYKLIILYPDYVTDCSTEEHETEWHLTGDSPSTLYHLSLTNFPCLKTFDSLLLT